MVAEGNFYIAEVVIKRELKSKFAVAMAHCKDESELYAKCVDGAQINRSLARDVCEQERVALRRCVDRRIIENRNPSSTKV